MSMRNGDKARTAQQKHKVRVMRAKLRAIRAQKKSAPKKQSGS